jgi:hypothetical protein
MFEGLRWGVKCTLPYYILAVLLLTLAIRVFLCLIKARAIREGAQDMPGKKWSEARYWYIFRVSFVSFGYDWNIDDYWLPAIIGAAELFAFPLLMSKGAWSFIAFWMGMKTVVSWKGWEKTRTGYNRFLVGNILSLACSVVLTWVFLPLPPNCGE